MSEIASGGEMARIMLSLKSVLNEKDGVGCSVYDEIDTGISGKTSRKIGIKLHEIASRGQVICVTHSAQIATLADDHYLIAKREVDGRAQTSVRLIEGEERVAEAARILGGINVTEAQRQAARDMIENISE
jgi:DNA repair protein RecN (Recombination protein N)